VITRNSNDLRRFAAHAHKFWIESIDKIQQTAFDTMKKAITEPTPPKA